MHCSEQNFSAKASRATDMNELLLNLYALSQERHIESFQEAALELIKPIVRFDAAVWGSGLVKIGGIDIHTFHLHQKTPDMVKAYDDVKHLDSSSAGMLSQQRLTRAFHAPSFFKAKEKNAIRDFMRRYKQPNFMLSTEYDVQANYLNWVTLYRSDADAQCTDNDVNLLALIAPHLLQALTFNRTAHQKKIGEIQLTNASAGIAIADVRGVVLSSNPQFTLEVLGSPDAFLPGRYRLSTEILSQLLSGSKYFIWRKLVMQCKAEAGLFFIKVRDVQKIDLLTKREKQIAELVAKGYTHKEIATTLYRAPATIRNTIQTIHAKLEVNGIAELVEALRTAR